MSEFENPEPWYVNAPDEQIRYDFSIGKDNEKYSELEDIPYVDLPQTEKELAELITKERIDLTDKTFKIIEYTGHYEKEQDYMDGEYTEFVIFCIDNEEEYTEKRQSKFLELYKLMEMK